MNSKIKIALLPLDIAWCDPAENLHNVESQLLKLHPNTDIVVLPELFSTGFIHDPNLIASMGGSAAESTLSAVRTWASRFNVGIAGSFLVKEGEKIYNRAFFVEPHGDETFYDKHHLFCMSPESQTYTHGSTPPPVVRFRGWNISMIVCYDLRFPVWCRNAANEAYDILLVPANWPVAREHAWKHLLIARAIENQAVVVGANRSGRDDYGEYDNTSYIFDPLGRQLAPLSPISSSDIIYAEYHKEDVARIRKHMPVGRDADAFAIQ